MTTLSLERTPATHPRCRPHFSFAGHTAVVTGGCRGIGLAIADALHRSGADVHIFDVRPPDPAFPHQFATVDITDPKAVDTAVAGLPAPATLLVNNAGITRDRSLSKMSDAEWAAVIATNLTGAFNMIRAMAPRMAAVGLGRIVNVSSINGLRGKFGQANYAAAKAGLIGLTKTAAREFGKKGITVNVVAPGMVMTDMARALPPDIVAKASDEAVLPMLAEPSDISDAVLFLLSDAARAITGEVLRVDAGQYI